MVHLLQTMLKRSGIGWGVCKSVCLSVFGSVPSLASMAVWWTFLWPVQWENSSWSWSDWLPWAFPGFPDIAGKNWIFSTKMKKTQVLCPRKSDNVLLIMSYHCVSIFTRDYGWGLGVIHFVFDWPPHLDYISFFFLYLSIASVGNKPPTGWEN